MPEPWSSARSLRYSIFQIGFLSNPWLLASLETVVVLQMGFTYLPFMNNVFETAPIGLPSLGQHLGPWPDRLVGCRAGKVAPQEKGIWASEPSRGLIVPPQQM